MATITALDTTILRLPYRRVVKFKSVEEDTGEYVLLRIRTSEGHEGIAEAVTRPLQTGDDGHILAYVIATFLEPMIVGLDPLAHSEVERRFRHLKGQETAKSLVDVALWDLKGKILGEPVWRLLGGTGQDVDLTWVVHGKDVETMLEEACARASAGYALKLKAHGPVRDAVALIRQVRESVGEDVIIYVDANANYRPPEGRRLLEQIADCGIVFAEEPCSFSSVQQQAQFATSISVPLLGDQSVKYPEKVYEYACAGAIGAASVKLRRSGFTDSLRTIAICRAAGLPALIGTDSESRIGALARLHLRAGMAQDMDPWPTETHFFDKLAEDVFEGNFAVRDGAVGVTDEPGFGASIDESRLKEYMVDHA